MKYLATFIFIFLIPIFGIAQETINGSILHDNLERTYILYVPANYNANEPVPLVFNFHGYTSNADAQMWYGDFRAIADTVGFLIVHPQGTLFNGSTHWNVGGWTVGSQADDVGFTVALLDELATEYNIDMSRVYSTGMSNGGYMSFLLACQASDRFAAVASVTGSMTPETYNDCNPQHPTPILQIHGTDDSVVPYEGDTWTKSVDEVLQYWVDYNNCVETPTITDVPNTSTVDFSTVEHFVYEGGDHGATTEHFKITGGGHTWAGTVFTSAGTNYDIDASEEIWNFFSRYNIDGLIGTSNVNNFGEMDFVIYPNPTTDIVIIENDFQQPTEYQLFSSFGQNVQTGIVASTQRKIDLVDLHPGIYILRIGGQSFKILKMQGE